MIVAVFGDAHAHADALEAVIAAATEHGVDELWSLGDMVGRGPDPEHVGAANAAACLEKQRAPLGLIGHTHVAAAWHEHTRRVRIIPGEPLDISEGKWLLDLEARTATWRSAPFDPAPAHARVRELGLDDG